MAGMVQVDLGDLDVPIGASVQLEFISPSSRHVVRVLGHIKGCSLILSTPRVNGKNILVRDGQLVNIRLMLKTQVCAFSSKVAKSYLDPAAHLHIAYPAYVETSIVRQTARVYTKLITTVEVSGKPDSISEPSTAVIVDLSLGGAKLISKDDFGTIGQSMRLVFNVKVGEFSQLLKVETEIKAQEIQMLEQAQSLVGDSDFLSRMGGEYFYVYGVSFAGMKKDIGLPLTAYLLNSQYTQE